MSLVLRVRGTGWEVCRVARQTPTTKPQSTLQLRSRTYTIIPNHVPLRLGPRKELALDRDRGPTALVLLPIDPVSPGQEATHSILPFLLGKGGIHICGMYRASPLITLLWPAD